MEAAFGVSWFEQLRRLPPSLPQSPQRHQPQPRVPEPAPERRQVFISYTRVDRQWVDRLQQMMKPLLRAGGQQMALWDDSQIEPGAKWRAAIETALAEAKVALLLVSDAFLASEFVMNEEVPKLLVAAEAEGVRVLWVSLSPCLVEHTPIAEYQAVLPLDHYLDELDKPQQQRALKTIAERIREALVAPGPEPEPKPEPEPEPEKPEARSQDRVPPPPPPQSPPAPPGLAPHTFRLETARILRVGNSWQVQRQPLQVEGALEDLGGGLSLPLVRIPAGEFVMGSPDDEPGRSSDEGPQHRVRLREFWMGQTPITQAQWRAVMDTNPSRFEDQPDSDQRPVENVGWREAMAFCQRLAERTGRPYSLPSEAQWEYACRAGTTTAFGFGATITPALANYDGNWCYANGPKGEYRKQSTPVGMFPANAWGLHDMHGNVWEWCLDHWHGRYAGAPKDGRAWVDTENENSFASRLLRGGSWYLFPRDCRSAFRALGRPGLAISGVGFRVVCLPQGPSLNSSSINPSTLAVS
jgi:formylglycine-generating enzyme required for sulfatase activity